MIKKSLMLLIGCVCFSLSSCITPPDAPVVKPPIVDATPSWDGNEQNSGVLGYIDGEGWNITQNAANRYNALIEKYGATFLPPLERGQGLKILEDGRIILSNEHMVKFIMMNKKHKES
jgi:hypothetical protein